MKIKKEHDGEVTNDNLDLNGEGQCDGTVVEYIHNANDSGEKNNHCEENNRDEENKDDQKSDENKHFKIPLSPLECFFLLGIPKNTYLTKEILNWAYRKTMKQAPRQS